MSSFGERMRKNPYVKNIGNAWPKLEAEENKPSVMHHGNWLGLVFVLLLLAISSMVVLRAADYYKAHAVAGNRFLARLNAPLVSTFYPQTFRDQVQVLLYDDAFINKEGLAWPMKYAEQAEYLRLAAGEGDPNLRPKAMFIDITFAQERPKDEDDSISVLRDAFCTIQVDWGIPVFLAALPKERGGPIKLRTGLMDAQKDGKPCFTLVDVTAHQDAMDGYAWTYQLSNGKGEPSPALAMARAASGTPIEVTAGERMAVDWGVVSAPHPVLEKWDACQMGTDDWWPKFPPYMYVPGWFKDKDTRPVCPYHAGVTMSWLAHAEESDWKKLVHGKYLFVGAQITGLNDVVNSPVHGLIAGVHSHAMAFDNLMTTGGNYKLAAEWSGLFSNQQTFLSLALVLVVVTLITFVCKYAAKWLVVNAQWVGQLDKATAAQLHWARRGLASVVKLLIWVQELFSKLSSKLKLVVTIVVMTAVGITVSTFMVWVFQLAEFRISYLAAMDLASMVIALEAFDILDGFVKWLSGEKEKCTCPCHKQ